MDLPRGIDFASVQEAPKIIGRYPIVRRLGRGGMGEVWLGHHPMLDLPVAIKTLPRHIEDEDANFAERLLREARTAARLNHAHLVRVLDAGIDGDRHFLVMEYVDGGSARDLLASCGGPLPESQAIEIVTRVAEGLAAASDLGVIHRDIKPDNILLTRDGSPKLADLGLAKQSVLGERSLTGTGISVGTPGYIAPEQARDPKTVDSRADIYSLGATLYHLCTGEPPFSGESPFEVMMKHVQEPLKDPRSLQPKISENTALLIQRMMAKDPRDRPQSVAILLRELETLAPSPSSRSSWVRIDSDRPAFPAPESSEEAPTTLLGRRWSRARFLLLARRSLALAIDLLMVLMVTHLLGGEGLVLWLLWILYAGLAVAWKKRTLGKRWLGLEIVTTNGMQPDSGTALLRAFGYVVSSLPLLMGFLWAIWDPDSETFHDKIAGTRVRARSPRTGASGEKRSSRKGKERG